MQHQQRDGEKGFRDAQCVTPKPRTKPVIPSRTVAQAAVRVPDSGPDESTHEIMTTVGKSVQRSLLTPCSGHFHKSEWLGAIRGVWLEHCLHLRHKEATTAKTLRDKNRKPKLDRSSTGFDPEFPHCQTKISSRARIYRRRLESDASMSASLCFPRFSKPSTAA